MSGMPEAMERSFTPDVEPQTQDAVNEIYDRLLAMPVDTEDELHALLVAWNETSCWIDTHIRKVNVAQSCDTQSEEKRNRWMQIITEVLPALTRRENELAQKFLDSPALSTLEDGPYAPFLRGQRTGVELFRDENVPLQQRVSELTTEYQQISGAWTIDFDGESRTISAMVRYLSDPDRSVRRDAWFAIMEVTGRDSERLEEIFDELVQLRHQIATNAGFTNFRDYMFVAKLRDYDAETCHNFARVVREVTVPLEGEIARRDASALGLDSYAPWDTQADPDGGEPLRPFEDVSDLMDGVERMMRRLDEELGAKFAACRPNMDLQARPGKAQGGFMSWFEWDRRPFIFANAAGKHQDIVTLLHEAGHAFHSLLQTQAEASPMADVTVPMEFNEVASMAMELLHYNTLDEFYDDVNRERAIQRHLRRVVSIFSRTLRGDQFQHWIYENPNHTRAQRRAKWLEISREFAPHIDRSEIDDDMLANGYHQILHFFIVPFYFVEYAFAQFGAIQVAMQADKDRAAAMAAYKHALSLGPARDVRGLYEAAGAQFDPTTVTLGAAMEWVQDRLN